MEDNKSCTNNKLIRRRRLYKPHGKAKTLGKKNTKKTVNAAIKIYNKMVYQLYLVVLISYHSILYRFLSLSLFLFLFLFFPLIYVSCKFSFSYSVFPTLSLFLFLFCLLHSSQFLIQLSLSSCHSSVTSYFSFLVYSYHSSASYSSLKPKSS